MQILIFSTFSEAENALAVIDANMGYPIVCVNWLTREPQPNNQQVLTWANITKCKTGGFYIPKPPDKGMVGVSGYVEETFSIDIHVIKSEVW